jgi:hypothetical protein
VSTVFVGDMSINQNFIHAASPLSKRRTMTLQP